jgi:ABC-type sugar transport system ATPase subunit
MNFLPAELKITPENIFVSLDRYAIELNQHFRPLLKDLKDMPILLGIRPEYLTLVESSDSNQNNISAVVTLIEPTGAVADVHLATEFGAKIVIRLDIRKIPPMGDKVFIKIDTENLHIFEQQEPGRNLTISPA